MKARRTQTDAYANLLSLTWIDFEERSGIEVLVRSTVIQIRNNIVLHNLGVNIFLLQHPVRIDQMHNQMIKCTNVYTSESTDMAF